MLKPRALRPGDRIAVVSPASPFKREEFDRGVEELRRIGYDPIWDESVFDRDMMVSGSPATRAAAFLKAWFDPSIAALVAVRGGYGSVHLLPLLSADDLRRSPKAFIAYSDNTSLLTWLTVGCGIVAFHGPTVAGRFEKGEAGYHLDSFVSSLTGAMGDVSPAELVALSSGEAEGRLYGGTLTQLLASFSTPFAFDPPDGCVLFLEEVNERPYKLDRMLMQLRLAGMLQKARGIIFGEMRGCDEPGGSPTAREVITRAMADFPGPVLFGFPSGHTTGPSWTLPLGVRVRVIGAGRPRLIFDEPAVL